MKDLLNIADTLIENRLFVGTGKFPSKAIVKDVLDESLEHEPPQWKWKTERIKVNDVKLK